MQPVHTPQHVATRVTWALLGPPRAAGGICMRAPCILHVRLPNKELRNACEAVL